ncbi:MAG: hypothetical protein AB7D51_00275 [Desulfovibrionaceae bacterium]
MRPGTAALVLAACALAFLVALRFGVLLLVFPMSAAAVVLAAVANGRRRTRADFGRAGLGGLPSGGRLALGGVYRPTKIVECARIALGPAAPGPTHNKTPRAGASPRAKSAPGAVHLWIVFPEPFPVPFAFTASCPKQSHMEQSHMEQSHMEQSHMEQSHMEQGRMEQGRMDDARLEGDFPDMAELLASPNMEERTRELLAQLAPFGGRLSLDERMLELTLPVPADGTPPPTVDAPLARAAVAFWAALRQGSAYPYCAS